MWRRPLYVVAMGTRNNIPHSLAWAHGEVYVFGKQIQISHMVFYASNANVLLTDDLGTRFYTRRHIQAFWHKLKVQMIKPTYIHVIPKNVVA